MREISNVEETIEVCKALGSAVRMNLIRMLSKKKQMNLNELAAKLNITNGAMTQHVKILVDAGLIDITLTSGKRGSQKICHLKENRLIIDFLTDVSKDNMYLVEIPVGSYTNYSIYPTCGIATKNSIIGEVDDPRYFDAPERSDASILWFGRGFVEYRIPNYLKPNQTLKEIQMSFEISSEAPGICEEWPSDIHFHLNDVHLGYWTSPGDFGAIRGIYTPSWWWQNCNQYGILKLLTINTEGTFIDGRQIAKLRTSDLEIHHKSDIIFRFSVPNDAENIGGLTIFGKGFGNYNQQINARMIFE